MPQLPMPKALPLCIFGLIISGAVAVVHGSPPPPLLVRPNATESEHHGPVISPDTITTTNKVTKRVLPDNIPDDFWESSLPPSILLQPSQAIAFEFLHCTEPFPTDPTADRIPDGECHYTAGVVHRGSRLHLSMPATKTVIGTCGLGDHLAGRNLGVWDIWVGGWHRWPDQVKQLRNELCVYEWWGVTIDGLRIAN